MMPQPKPMPVEAATPLIERRKVSFMSPTPPVASGLSAEDGAADVADYAREVERLAEDDDGSEHEDGEDVHMPLQDALKSIRRKSQVLVRTETVEVAPHHVERDGAKPGFGSLLDTLSVPGNGIADEPLADDVAAAREDAAAATADEVGNPLSDPASLESPTRPNLERSTSELVKEDEDRFWPLIENLGDALRCTIECDSDDAMLESWQQVQAEFKIEDITDGDGNEGAGGRLKNNLRTDAQKPPDMLINVRFDAGGYEMVAEIQIHLRSIHRLKQMNHVLYEIVRAPSIEELRLKRKDGGSKDEDGENENELVEMRGRLVSATRELEVAKRHSEVVSAQSTTKIKERDGEIAALKQQLAALKTVMNQPTKPNKPTLSRLSSSVRDTAKIGSSASAGTSTDRLTPGCEVRLEGLTERTDLNGRVGVVSAEQFADSQLPNPTFYVLVAMPGGKLESVKVKSKNLMRQDPRYLTFGQYQS